MLKLKEKRKLRDFVIYLKGDNMKLTIEMDVTDCRNCCYKKDHYGHGQCWAYCSNPNNGRGAYEDILWGCQGKFVKIPDWCPIFKEKI